MAEDGPIPRRPGLRANLGRPVGLAVAARTCASACLISLVAGVTIIGQADFAAPPRYDGAGYAVLARSLLEGSGYRAIDHPDRPRHAHFPPGYPAVLALVWKVTGPSTPAAHVLSCLASISATTLAWLWFRRHYPRRVALALGLALAVNWNWSRTGSTIQSEPLFLFLSQCALLAVPRSRSAPVRCLMIGALLAACFLTRQVAIGLTLAILIELSLRAGWMPAFRVLAVFFILILPWLLWLVQAGRQERTQASLLRAGALDLAARLSAQGLFYLERIPDQLTGPLVEFATVIRRTSGLELVAILWATACTAVILMGWVVAVRRRRRRLAGLVPLATLGLLLVWPYTEAGRFLIPLIPFLLVGAVEGLRGILAGCVRLIGRRPGVRRLRSLAALLLLALSLPYTAYSMMTGRARRAGASDGAFDAACAWLTQSGDRPGPVLTRHPGEVFLATGRQALEVSTSERPGDQDAAPADVAALIARYHVAYLLVDEDRYLRAAGSPLREFVASRPERVRRVGTWGADRASVVLYEVVP